MIAPYRQTEPVLDERAQVMARARRAVATALLRERPATAPPPANNNRSWKAWLFVGWTVLVPSVVIVGTILGWWNGIDY